ncbi:p-loop domain-containing protein [Desulfonema limicola]|uniref:P-loop domain-containing protein n=1 Tax=Desulfonema limicola TaxID=45656 RepID=A0A975B9V4_9BACT|nr:hypothetical protein [Desulfonema limicola]QTA81430.1 p-loop domain-containing protein [Desulfonema limicola]
MKMQYPLPERIGNPDLLVGREKDFRLLNRWIENIPKRISKSRVILARRKSGKTAVIQRIFNRLWTENGEIIPFYFAFQENKIWYPDLAVEYFRIFASHYISFFKRDDKLLRTPLHLHEIKKSGLPEKFAKLLSSDVDAILNFKEMRLYGSMWKTAYTAPDRYAAVFDQRILVILDEFQNISQYVYHNEGCEGRPDETLAGSFHDVVESKLAPMLVTGSYVGWLISIMDKYLEAGRLKRHFMTPYLTPEEGLQAVYKYSEICNVPVSNETAVQINRLCMFDPFFISCVIQSEYEGKNLTVSQGVVNAVDYEITDPGSEMSMTWNEYIDLTLQKINDIHAKNMLLFLSRHTERDWTAGELKKELNLDIDEKKIREKLEIMRKADVIATGSSPIRYSGLKDGTICLILRHHFEEEITSFKPDLKKDFYLELEKMKKERDSVQGRLNNLLGKFAEFQLFTDFRSRKEFPLSLYFQGVKDNTRLNIIEVRLRDKFQRQDGKEMEIDVRADSECGRVVLVEVKKTEKKTGIKTLRLFMEKTKVFQKIFPGKKVLPAFLSIGGFTKEAMTFCLENGIGTAEKIEYFQNFNTIHISIIDDKFFNSPVVIA